MNDTAGARRPSPAAARTAGFEAAALVARRALARSTGRAAARAIRRATARVGAGMSRDSSVSSASNAWGSSRSSRLCCSLRIRAADGAEAPSLAAGATAVWPERAGRAERPSLAARATASPRSTTSAAAEPARGGATRAFIEAAENTLGSGARSLRLTAAGRVTDLAATGAAARVKNPERRGSSAARRRRTIFPPTSSKFDSSTTGGAQGSASTRSERLKLRALRPKPTAEGPASAVGSWRREAVRLPDIRSERRSRTT